MVVTIITFLVILSILVLVHELGHFVVARLIGVNVEEFGLGLPPRAVGKKVKGTVYSLNWLPIGGFVKLAGEDEEETSKQKAGNRKQYFWARTKKERAAILLAGVAMNFLLAVGITAYLLTQGVMEPSGRVRVERVMEESPAQSAGLKAGDVVKEIRCQKVTATCGTQAVTVPSDLITFTRAHKGEAVILVVERGNEELTVSLTPRTQYPAGQGPMGVAISDLEKKTYSLLDAPIKAVEISLSRAWDMLRSIGFLVWRIITLQPLQADVAGPIGIAEVTGQAVKFGWMAVLEFMSVLSLNLAVLNVLPIPALDGGRLAFVFLEKLLGRRIKPAFEKSTHQVGMIILFALILLVSINDILRIARGG